MFNNHGPQDPSSFISGSFGLTFGLIWYVLTAYPLYVMAQKCNLENPWFAFIPVLNLITLCQLAGKEWWWILLLFVPCVNVFIGIVMWMAISERMNKPSWVGILTIVPVVGFFVPFYLAFG